MKIYQIPYVIFQTTSQLFFKYYITLQSHDTQLLCNFLAQTLHISVKRIPLKCTFWDFWVLGQNSPNFSCHFSKHKSVPFQILHHFQCYDITSQYFFGSSIIYFQQKHHIKVQLFRLTTTRIKVHQIPHAIFGTKSQFFFKLCITLQSYET